MSDRRRALDRGAGDHRRLVCETCAGGGKLSGEELVRWRKERVYKNRYMRCCRCGRLNVPMRILRVEGDSRPVASRVRALVDEAELEGREEREDD